MAKGATFGGLTEREKAEIEICTHCPLPECIDKKPGCPLYNHMEAIQAAFNRDVRRKRKKAVEDCMKKEAKPDG
jgi:NADPH-dependent glutamate synthase beta subunit-like oxidoreductase